jgi:hypothetical protein
MDTTTYPTTSTDEPCIVCGAPVDRFGLGHDRGCIAEQPPRAPRWLAWTRANNVAKELAR